MVAIGMIIPPGLGLAFGSAFYRFWIGGLIALVLVFIPKFRVGVVEGDPRNVLSDLAHRLRVSRYSVVEKKSMLSVVVSKYTAANVTAKRIPEGTLVRYQASATPSAWTIIILLLLFMFTIPFALVIALFCLYQSAVFASYSVLPGLTGPSAKGVMGTERDTRAVLIDSLSEGRRLSTEAYEAAKSNYEDAIIIFVTIGIVLSLVVALAVMIFSFTMAPLVGLASAVLFSLVSWRLLAKRTKPRLAELKSWSVRFDAALTREIASQSPPDGEPSSFELVAESLREAPNWLRILGKSGMFREPGYWIMIIFLCLAGVELCFAGIFSLVSNGYSEASVFLLISAVFLLSSLLIYRQWKKVRDEEYGSTMGSLSSRHEALKAEMENYLRDV
jgi:hypothetical protein